MSSDRNMSKTNTSPTSLDLSHESSDEGDIVQTATHYTTHTTPTLSTQVTSSDLAKLLAQLTISLTNTIESRLEQQDKRLKEQNTQLIQSIETKITEQNTMTTQHLKTELAEQNAQLSQVIETRITEQKAVLEQQNAQLQQNLDKKLTVIEERMTEQNRISELNTTEHFDEIKQMIHSIETTHTEEITNIHSRLEQLETFCDNAQTKSKNFQESLDALKVEHKNTITLIQTTIQQDHSATIQHITETQQQTHKLLDGQNQKIEECNQRIIALEQRPASIPNGNSVPEIIVNLPSTSSDQGLPHFSGRSINPIEYLSKLKKYYQRQIRSKSQSDTHEILHEIIELSLDSYASRWWQLIKSEIYSWEEFEKSFLQKYWNKQVQQGILKRIELERFHRNGRQSRTEYVESRVVLLRSMTPEMSDEDIIERLSEHFDELIQNAVKVQNISTITDFQLLLQKEDLHDSNTQIKYQTNNHHNIPPPRRNNIPSHSNNNNRNNFKDHNNRFSHTHFRNTYHPYRPTPDHKPNHHYSDKRLNTPNNFKGHNYYTNHSNSPPKNSQHHGQWRVNHNPNYSNYHSNSNQANNSRTHPARDLVNTKYPSPEQVRICQMLTHNSRPTSPTNDTDNKPNLSPGKDLN